MSKGIEMQVLRESVQLSNASASPLRIVIEPWAIDFDLPSRSFCEVVSVGGVPPASIDVEDHEYGIIFWINTSGAIYEYWLDGQLLD
jgi:hypothetical protein